MIKVSAVIGTSIVAVLLVSLLGLNQNEIKSSQLTEPLASSILLDECPYGDIEDCMAFYGNTDHKVLEVKDINVMEKNEDLELGFDVKNYLPKDFNPYSSSEDFNESSIDSDYLTSDMDGTVGSGVIIQNGDYKPVSVAEIVVLENDDIIDLGFNVKDYLPRNFNPYASK